MTQEEIRRIFDTLGDGPRSYYVYALCTAAGPFYIGKGHGTRVLAHQEAAQLAEESVNSDETLTGEEKSEKIRAMSAKLQTIIANKEKMELVIVKWGLTSQEAFMCESSLINMLKFCKGTTIPELTNIVNGHASALEKSNASDEKTKARTLSRFLQECAVSPKDISAMRGKAVLIKINTTYPKCFTADGLPDDDKIRGCVGGTWKINQRAQQGMEYVFALYKGRVVGIYHIVRIATSLGEEYLRDPELPELPVFPEEDRRVDRMVAKYPTIEEAERDLPPDDFQVLVAALKPNVKPDSARMKNLQDVLDSWRSRGYYVLDKAVPEDVMPYMNTLVTLGGSQAFIQCENPVQYRF